VIGAEPAQISVLAAASSALIDYLSAPGFDEARARLAGPAIDRLRDVVLGTLMPRGGRVAVALAAMRGDQVADDDLVAAFAQLLTGAMEPLTSAVVTATVAAARRHGAVARRHGAAPDRPAPGEIAELIEESLLMEPPFHFAPRVAGADLSVDGHRIGSGERVVLNLLHANDEIAAGSGSEHLSFGYGTHYCLGAAASRLHLQAALAAALDVGLPARLAIDRVVRRRGFGATAYLAAPVTR
jgi:cytochrome P450